MNTNDVIESYVSDVSIHLPRKQRNDVAFELRALLNEELHAKAEASGRAADAAMATELARAFGRPAEVAARYLPTLTIIDPADGHLFLKATVIGLGFLWGVGLLVRLPSALGSVGDFLNAVAGWYGSTVIPSLWWPGVLVVGFGTAAWVRRRWPQTSEWKPRAGDRIHGSRAGRVVALFGILLGLFVLTNPRWLLDVVFGGRAAHAAYDALTYTNTFRQRQGPILLALLLLNIPMFIAVIVAGRWTARLRLIERGLGLAMCVILTWTVLDGPVFMTSDSDRMVKYLMTLIVVATLVGMAVKLYRSVRPAPNPHMPA